MSDLHLILAAVVTVLSAARITRLVVYDKFPPIAWIRAKWEIHAPTGWEDLLTCRYCFPVYPTTGIVLWGYFADWPPVWWIVNGILGGAYLASMVVTFDGELVD